MIFFCEKWFKAMNLPAAKFRPFPLGLKEKPRQTQSAGVLKFS
jgi:hypothetical protein